MHSLELFAFISSRLLILALRMCLMVMTLYYPKLRDLQHLWPPRLCRVSAPQNSRNSGFEGRYFIRRECFKTAFVSTCLINVMFSQYSLNARSYDLVISHSRQVQRQSSGRVGHGHHSLLLHIWKGKNSRQYSLMTSLTRPQVPSSLNVVEEACGRARDV